MNDKWNVQFLQNTPHSLWHNCEFSMGKTLLKLLLWCGAKLGCPISINVLQGLKFLTLRWGNIKKSLREKSCGVWRVMHLHNPVFYQHLLFKKYAVSISKTVLFQTIQFSISTQFSSIRPIDSTLSGITTLGSSRTGSDDKEGVLRIPQTSRITGTSLSLCLESYPGHWLGDLTPLQKISLCIKKPQLTG